MNETAAAEVLLLRAYESTGFAGWGDADRAWASRSALQSVGADAPAAAFLAARAQAGLGRLAALDPMLARWRALRPWHRQALWLVVALAFVAGLVVDHIGSAQRINLLAPPVWAVIAWNLAVYLALLLHPLWAAGRPGALRAALAGALARWRQRRLGAEGGSAPVWSAFAADWAQASAPLQGARLAVALHLGAAALALGLLAGMYLRGLVLDYRVGWQSTFLDAATVQPLLATLLAPASALSGIAVPDLAGIEALRLPQAEGVAASAAPWIHLYALQLLLLVLLPRAVLALWAARRAAVLRCDLPLPLAEPYFVRLLRQAQGGQQHLRLWPHARTPDAQAIARLKALLQRIYGDGVSLQVEPTVAYGSEDTPVPPAADGALRLVLCDLGATPEPESQGRLLQALGRPLLLVDEAAFVQRFGAGSPRRDERRQAWSALAASLGCAVVFIDLQAADLAASEAALQAALERAAA
ncbi:MAG: DUF2868 domain-containing protein [Rubrivivax sp.]|nr:DUF2868 domain-containing protein [Rubrivivax sp.]